MRSKCSGVKRSCDCATRFPSWDTAEAVFRERYASDERWEMLQASEGYNRRANAARLEATGEGRR